MGVGEDEIGKEGDDNLAKICKVSRTIKQLYMTNNLDTSDSKYYRLDSTKMGTSGNTSGVEAHYVQY